MVRKWWVPQQATPTPGGAVAPPDTAPPIYPHPGEIDCNSGYLCACDVVDIKCTNDDAWSEGNCTIRMPLAACVDLGIFDGEVQHYPGGVDAMLDPECLLLPPDTPPVLDGLGQIKAYCGLQHEATHSCHPDHEVATACSEEIAYGRSQACFQDVFDRQCVGASPTPDYCDALDDLIDGQYGQGELERCLCEGGGCAQCVADCKDAGGPPSVCEQYSLIACHRDGIEIATID